MADILCGERREMSLSNRPMRRGRRERAAWGRAGSSLNSCLSNSPGMRKISLPLLVTKSFPALYTAGMNHPLSPSSAPLPVVRLVSHLSPLQRLLKVHQDILLHKSFTAMTACALAPWFHSICFLRLSEREISVMLGDYTCKSDTQGFKRKREEKRTKAEKAAR